MVALINLPRAAWKRQPQGGINILWSHPLIPLLNVKGIMVGGIGTPYAESVLGSRSYFNVNKPVAGRQGLRTGLYGSGVATLSGSVCKINGNSRSVFVLADALVYSGSSYLLGAHSEIGLRMGGSGVSALIETTVTTYYTDYIVPRKGDFAAWCVWDYEANMGTLYCDDESASVTTTGTHTYNTTTLRLGGLAERGVYFVVACQGAVNDAALRQELIKNPWQLFAPRDSRFYLIPSGASSYQLVSSLASASESSATALNVLRAVQTALTSASSTDTITLDTTALISLLSAIASASTTPASAAAIHRNVSSALTSASTTASAAAPVQRNFLTALSSESNAPAITLSIAGLLALLTALSSQSSTATSAVSVQRALLSALTSQSATGDISLNTTTLIALLSAVASTSLSSTSALNIARALSTAINSPSTTADVALPVQRPFVTAQTSQSSTSISVLELINLIGLASAVSSQSSTSTAMANLARALVSELLSASSTATIPLPVIRDLAAMLVSTSLTDAIDLSLTMLGQIDLASLIQSASLTNPQARLLADLVAAIQGEMKVQMTDVAPAFTITGVVPSFTITGSGPSNVLQ